MSKLTNREQIMLIILAFFLLAAGSYSFLIMPSLDRLNQMEAELDGLREEQLNTRMTIIEAEAYAEGYEANIAAIEDAKKKLYLPMSADALDKLATNLCMRHALTPTELSVDMAPAQAKQEQSDVEGAAEPPPYYTVTLKANGDYDGLMRLIDEIDRTPALSAAGYSYSEQSSDAPVMLVLDVYIYDEAAYEGQDAVIGAMPE